MQHDFVVTLRRDQARRTDLAGFCLLFFSFVAFLLTWVRSGFTLQALAVAALAMLAGVVINILRAKKKRDIRFRYWLLAAAIGWAIMPYGQWILVLFLLFALWETQARYPLEIGFTEREVVINTLIKRRIRWNELQSVILKDGLLTLDFRNNRLLQREVLEDDEPDAEEDEFNLYCRQQLERQTADGGRQAADAGRPPAASD